MLETRPSTDRDAPTGARAVAHRPPRASRRSLVAAFVAGAVVTGSAFLVADLGGGDALPAAPVDAQDAPDVPQEPDQQAGSGVEDRLTWAPPELTDPETVEVSQDTRDLRLEPDQDYVVAMPDEPLDVRGGLVISGGRNVVLIGGEIRISESGDAGRHVRGLFLKDQTGTVHVEGLLISGDQLGEGINLDQREGAVVQLQNVRVETVQGEEEGQHADVLQTWAGPAELRVDRLTGYTTYQGFFLLPQQFGEQPTPDLFDLRNVNIVGDDAGYMLWRDGPDWPIAVENVWVSPTGEAEPQDGVERRSFLWATGGDDGADAWDDVEVGIPPGGDFVPAGAVGLDYRSPGYAQSREE